MRKLVGMAMVRNEADIVESFVRYNLRLLDELVMVVHSSTDETLHIVEQLKHEGLPVIIHRNEEVGFDAKRWINKAAQEIFATRGADFLFMLDGDEFLKSTSRAYLEDAISAIPMGTAAALRWESYVPMPIDLPTERNVIKRIQYRAAKEAKPIYKVTLSKRFYEDANLVVAVGNHSVMQAHDGKIIHVPHVAFCGATLAHFPVRTEAQLISKALIGVWASWVDQGGVNKDMTINVHWQKFYRELMASGQISSERLRDIALDYQHVQQNKGEAIDRTLIHDPLDIDFELKYTPAPPTTALASVAQWVEQLIDNPQVINRGDDSTSLQNRAAD